MNSQKQALDKIVQAQQLIVVVTDSWQGIAARLSYFTKNGANTWRVIKPATAVVIGKSGLAWTDKLVPKFSKCATKARRR